MNFIWFNNLRSSQQLPHSLRYPSSFLTIFLKKKIQQTPHRTGMKKSSRPAIETRWTVKISNVIRAHWTPCCGTISLEIVVIYPFNVLVMVKIVKKILRDSRELGRKEQSEHPNKQITQPSLVLGRWRRVLGDSFGCFTEIFLSFGLLPGGAKTVIGRLTFVHNSRPTTERKCF